VSRPDSSAIANALIAKLGADTELLQHVPDNVHEDMGPEGAKRFVVVSQILATDQAVMNQGRVIEDALFLVEARVLKGSGPTTACAAAAARIETLLEDGTMDVPGYRVTAIFREEFVRGTEIDEIDTSIVWKRRGGRYRVTAYREAVASAVFAESLYDPKAEMFGLLYVVIWFDGPLKVPDTGGITVTVISSNPALTSNKVLNFTAALSDYNVTDPAAPGRAYLAFRLAFDMQGLAGVTFTLSAASPRGNWHKILNRDTGAPVADSLGDVVLVIPILPAP
jgi:hypothetical protein